jgi:hypothetical protein
MCVHRYLLELDGSGNIIGGEWAFSSPEIPDFLFMPFDRSLEIDLSFSDLDPTNIQSLIDSTILSSKNREFFGPAFVVPPSISSLVLVGESLEVPEDDRFAVFLTSLDIGMNCTDDIHVLFYLYHGLSRVEFRCSSPCDASDCRHFETYAFANMMGAGNWTLEMASAQGVLNVTAWSLNVSEKQLFEPLSWMLEE